MVETVALVIRRKEAKAIHIQGTSRVKEEIDASNDTLDCQRIVCGIHHQLRKLTMPASPLRKAWQA